MTLRGLILLIIEAVFLFLSLGLGSREIYIISISLGVFLLYSVLSVIFAATFLRTENKLNRDVINRNDEVDFTVKFKGLVVFPVVGEIKILPPGTRKKFAKEIITHTFLLVFGRMNKNYEFPLKCLHRGYWNVGIESLYFKDIFGLFSVPAMSNFKLMATRVPIEVNPNVHNILVPARKLSTVNGFTSSTMNNSSDGDSLGDSREYRVGDPVKRVHWKLSARTGKLFVRDFEAQENTHVLIVIDTVSFNEYNEMVADIACETAISLVDYYLAKGQSIKIVSCRQSDNKIIPDNEFSITDESDFDNALSLLTGIVYKTDINPFDLIHAENSGIERVGTAFVITDNPSKELFESVSSLTKQGINMHCIIPQINNNRCEMLKNFNPNFYNTPIVIETPEQIAERLEGEL